MLKKGCQDLGKLCQYKKLFWDCWAFNQSAVWLWHATALLFLAPLCVTSSRALIFLGFPPAKSIPCLFYLDTTVCMCVSEWLMYMSAPLLTCWPDHLMKPCVHSKIQTPLSCRLCLSSSLPTNNTRHLPDAQLRRFPLAQLAMGRSDRQRNLDGRMLLRRTTSPGSNSVE